MGSREVGLKETPGRPLLSLVVFSFFIGFVLSGSVFGFAQSTSSSTLYLPLLPANHAGDLGLALSNPTLSDISTVITARTYNGTLISGPDITNPVTVILPASSQKAQRATEIFGSGIGNQSGWVEIQSSDPAIKGFFLLFDSSVTYIDGAELSSSGSRVLIFPKIVTTPTSATDVTFVNVGSDSSQAAMSL